MVLFTMSFRPTWIHGGSLFCYHFFLNKSTAGVYDGLLFVGLLSINPRKANIHSFGHLAMCRKYEMTLIKINFIEIIPFVL
jgi:hypothetical protein